MLGTVLSALYANSIVLTVGMIIISITDLKIGRGRLSNLPEIK